MTRAIKMTYVLVVTEKKTFMPVLAPATRMQEFDYRLSFDVYAVAVSDDLEALGKYARELSDKFPTITCWNTFRVPVIGDTNDN